MADASTSLAGKRVVVLGGGTGIGFAVARLAQSAGATVVVASSRAATVEAAATELPGATGTVVDLRKEADVESFFAGLGAFDHLAITAGDWGGDLFTPARTLDLDRARDGFAVRFWGALAAVKHGCRTIAPDGSIVLTSGLLAHRPSRGAPLATALGGAVEHLARGLAVDLAPVRVNVVSPGIILTDHVARSMPQDRMRAFTGKLPVARAGTPVEAAQAYLYFMSNGYVTGQTAMVDGGGSSA